ncbi:MAG: T9SS type A sorting domain-containing protein, partial [Saprospiraceae bacterium]|nr:T9SS type A sorting domain-containing protein [Saprospiraceae bacterium]
LGREVGNFTVEVYTGLNRQEINLQRLPPGTYIVKMKINEWVDHKRIIKTY